jgi:uncharacterized membrane protein YGL010W
MGLVWAIPFPHIKFLGKYNSFINWASFLIAFAVYYYYRLSAVLSYLMLLILFGFSYLIIDLVSWQKTGGPLLWESCLVIFVLSWAGQFIGHKIEGKKPSFFDDLKFLLIGPIWLLHFNPLLTVGVTLFRGSSPTSPIYPVVLSVSPKPGNHPGNLKISGRY